ncbi:hypothetical protein V8G54_029324 [Vigna mungo]|uniref:Ubiquitin-like domain-containing protein n=1 Tax=Vigna mungo TaxID=3915 RepID=A0AAQ3RJ30_VIGMU
MDMYIRVKRSKTTYFIRCKASDKTIDIKQKLQELVDQPTNNQRLILPGNGEVLEDSKTLADQKVENDAVVALTLRKGNMIMSLRRSTLFGLTISTKLEMQRVPVGKAMANSHYGWHDEIRNGSGNISPND